jgi:hypothetical protein
MLSFGAENADEFQSKMVESIEKCKLTQDIYENAELVQQQLVILNKCNELFDSKKIIERA